MEHHNNTPGHPANGTPIKKVDQTDQAEISYFNKIPIIILLFPQHQSQCEEAPGMFANFITLGSLLLVLVSLPLSLFFVVKVVQVNTEIIAAKTI